MLRDLQLLAAYRLGEKKAFTVLYERYANPLRRFLQGGFSFSSQGRICRFKGADAGMDVEALVQETFARAFVSSTRKNYDGVRPFQTYLFSIAKNLVLRECSHRDRLISVEEIDIAADGGSTFSTISPHGHSDSPEKSAADLQLRNITDCFVASLTEEERSFFSARFAKGLTQESTALRLGTTRARVKLLEKNVRRRFLEQLQAKGYFVDYAPNPRWKRQNEEDGQRAHG